jgi:phenylalanyl-tRNA synthetase alpha chain
VADLPTLQGLVDELDRLLVEFRADVALVGDEPALRAAQARYLGRKGRVSDVMKALGRLPAGDRPALGEAANRTKDAIEKEVAARLDGLAQKALDADLARRVDVTLPGRAHRLGHLHPLTQVQRRIEQIFLGLGYSVAEGPQVETDWHNFEALNFPLEHPARDMQDTFFVADPNGDKLDAPYLLRTHTSPVQIRTMLAGPPPVRIIAPGVVYRRDDDATHSPMFTQVEGLCVAEGISLAHLKGTLLHFVSSLFGSSRVRLRPSFFPFTEPSAEIDMGCVFCKGSGCRLCKGTGWLEIGGSGMVHPSVLEAVGYDPERVTGFAFGMGIERMAMLLYGVDDIKFYYEGDVRFLEQF